LIPLTAISASRIGLIPTTAVINHQFATSYCSENPRPPSWTASKDENMVGVGCVLVTSPGVVSIPGRRRRTRATSRRRSGWADCRPTHTGLRAGSASSTRLRPRRYRRRSRRCSTRHALPSSHTRRQRQHDKLVSPPPHVLWHKADHAGSRRARHRREHHVRASGRSRRPSSAACPYRPGRSSSSVPEAHSEPSRSGANTQRPSP